MREYIEREYGCVFTAFAEFNGETEAFSCITSSGAVLVADSLGLLLGELGKSLDVVQLPIAA